MGDILAIRGGAIGDFILTLPALQLLKRGLDAEKIEVLGYPSIAQISVDFGFADAVRSIEYGALAGFFNPKANLDEELCAYFSKFSVIVSYLYDPDGFFHSNLERAGAKTVIRASHRVDESVDKPAAAQLAEPLESLALFLEEPYVSLGIERRPTRRIAIHPGSGSPLKNWGFENWAETTKRIHEQLPDYEFLVVSGEAESETIDEFLQLLEVPQQSLASAPLADVARELSDCALFLGHDSGVSHLAGAADVPSILVFGPTDPAIWAPRNPEVKTMRAPNHQLASVQVSTMVEKSIQQLVSSSKRKT
ncbi:MAG: glycosyltransferase family 9 protein [Verrucomicrobiota bacterium]